MSDRCIRCNPGLPAGTIAMLCAPHALRVTITRVGGYDPKLGPSHPDNQDPTLPPRRPLRRGR